MTNDRKEERYPRDAPALTFLEACPGIVVAMSMYRTALPTFSDRLGKKGFTIVARAPQVGLPQLVDGSWHVVGGSNPTQPELMHETNVDLIPFILAKGGDIVIYRLSDDGMGMAKPILSRGGMEGRPPDLSVVHSFDPALMSGLSKLHGDLASPAATQLPPKARPWMDLRLAACVGAGIVVLLGAAAYMVLLRPVKAVPGRWVPDMNDPRDVAITKGATVLVAPSTKDPDTLVMYRVYPDAKGKGKGLRDNVGSFNRNDLDGLEGGLPDSRMQWRRDF